MMDASEPTTMTTVCDTYVPTVKDLNDYMMMEINDMLHGETINEYKHRGPSNMEIWLKIAMELIKDVEVINTIEKMNKTRSRQWMDDLLLCKDRSMMITKLIEISKELKRNDIVIQLEQIYNRGVRYARDMREHEAENLANMLENNSSNWITASWKDYADKLCMPVNHIETLYEMRTPLLEIVLKYLKRWKPHTTLSSIQKICRDELHHIAANVIERMKLEISLGNIEELEEVLK